MVLRDARNAKAAAGLFGVTLLAMAFAVATSALAAEQAPNALATMRAAFAAAAKAKDVAQLAALTAFPLANSVYQEPSSLSKAAFPDRLIEYSERAACLASSPLTADVETRKTTKLWLVECDGAIFYFGLRSGQWRHVKFANVNE